MPAEDGVVSVIVPTHNRATLLKHALLSILNQRYPLIDLVVIANGCRDQTAHTIRELQSTSSLARAGGHAAVTTVPVPQVTWTVLTFKETLGGGQGAQHRP